LFVLLGVMLPLRGVMAAAMLCPPHEGAGSGGRAMHVAGDGAPAHAHIDGGAHHDALGGPAASSHHHAASATDTCNLCSACCSVPPVPSAAPAMPLPHDPAATVFPSFAAPAPTFQSEGPERPPRSS
jgi:hypothetical protein